MTTGQPRVVWYWYRVAGIDTPFPTKAKFLEIVSFFRRSAAAKLVTLSAACDGKSCVDATEVLRMALAGPP